MYVQIFLDKLKLYIVFTVFVHGYDVFKVFFKGNTNSNISIY